MEGSFWSVGHHLIPAHSEFRHDKRNQSTVIARCALGPNSPDYHQMNLVWDFVTNREALSINSAWAGEAGRLVNSTYDTTAPTPLFARPCSTSIETQRFILNPDQTLQSKSRGDRRCLSTVSCPDVIRKPQTGNLHLATCDGSVSQQWTLTANESKTSVKSASDGGCWEINGCDGTTVDTDYGCKTLPAGPLPCGTQCCNMAWSFKSTGQIVSGMSSQQCLQVSSKDESSVVVGPCVGAEREKWVRVGNSIASALGGCIDDHATAPLNPQYGPLMLADCQTSNCR